MPTSHYHQLNELLETIVLTNPTSILDVGVGLGKYGVLAREYLEIRRGYWQKEDWRCRIDGIEGFQAYLSPLHEFVYDHIFIGNVQQIVPQLKAHYDLAILIGILEHFEYEAGLTLVSDLQKHVDNLLISTPKQFILQGATFGNKLEAHKSYWRREDFLNFQDVCFIPNEISTICYIGKDKYKIEREIYSLRRRIKRHMPLLVYPFRAFRTLFSQVSKHV